MNPFSYGARAIALLVSVLACVLYGEPLRAQCVGDCNGDGAVSINELVTAVNVALGSRSIDDCPNADGNQDGSVGINELIRAVNNALNGCEVVEPTATATPQASATATSTETATATPTATGPTPTPTEPLAPKITHFALTAADDSLILPTTEENGVLVYELPFGRFFRILVEARAGSSRLAPGLPTFEPNRAPSLQIQADRPLGNGSERVCDGDDPAPGGVPGINPPSFEPTEMIIDALNDFGCRFSNGAPSPSPAGRACNSDQACLRFEDGTFGCESENEGAEVQYCSQLISDVEEFAVGDTLLSARVLECRRGPGCSAGRDDPLPGPIEQIIVRIVPPFPG